jgi:hypothetical protein
MKSQAIMFWLRSMGLKTYHPTPMPRRTPPNQRADDSLILLSHASQTVSGIKRLISPEIRSGGSEPEALSKGVF